MTLKKVEFMLPEEVFDSLGNTKQVNHQALQALLLFLVNEGKMSASRAAEILDVSYNEMLDLMAQHEIPIVNYSATELEEEVKALESFNG